MAHKTSKDMGFSIDNAAGAITDISGSVNSQAIQQAVTILDDTGIGDSAHTSCQGLSSGSLPINGMMNSTVDAIFGPVAQGTAVTKTFEYKNYTLNFYNGECHVENYEISGSPDTLETWSANLVVTGAINRTSKAVS